MTWTWPVVDSGAPFCHTPASTMAFPLNYPAPPPAAKTPFEQTAGGAYVVRAWEWLTWAYSRAIPTHVDNLRHYQRRSIHG